MSQEPSTRSLQLDVFRGCAALLMVLNHAGFSWLAPEDGTSGGTGAIVFAGSAAPALFFFATGVGMGLARKVTADWLALLRKVVLLLIADAFLNWAVHRWLGLDFFGFCAISMVAVALVDAASRPRVAATVALAGVLLLRYADAAQLERLVVDQPWLGFVTGVAGVEDVSYPLCPWLVFPLAGYLLGRASPRLDSAAAYAAMAAWAALALGGSLVMTRHGAVVHRWGSVSFAYLLFAVGFLPLVWLAARAACGVAALRFLRLRGPASLLVVPIHYAAIELAAAWAPPPWSPTIWLPAVCALALATLPAARWLAARLRNVAERPAAGPTLLAAVAVSVVCCALASAFASPLAGWLVACLSQVAIAANLARPPRSVIRSTAHRTL